MIALYKVNYWDEFDSKENECKGFVFSENEDDFLKKIKNYYGSNINSISFEFFEDCDTDVIEEENIINLLEK